MFHFILSTNFFWGSARVLFVRIIPFLSFMSYIVIPICVVVYISNPSKTNQILTGFIIGLFVFLALFPFIRDDDVKWNYKREDRIKRICEFISKAKQELTIYTAEFNSKIYNDDRILNALKSLPKDIKIRFYISKDEIDEDARGFLEFVSSRKLEIHSVDANIKPFMIADGKHVRLVLTLPKGNSCDQFAIFYYNRPDLTKSTYNIFEAAIRTLKLRKVKVL